MHIERTGSIISSFLNSFRSTVCIGMDTESLKYTLSICGNALGRTRCSPNRKREITYCNVCFQYVESLLYRDG